MRISSAYSPTPRPRPTPRQIKIKELTLEEKLSELRSQTGAWDISKEIKVLEAAIQKKKVN